jgi:hypothetical protein
MYIHINEIRSAGYIDVNMFACTFTYVFKYINMYIDMSTREFLVFVFDIPLSNAITIWTKSRSERSFCICTYE